MADTKARVYLAGPISGCNPKQRKKWREDFKHLFGREFAFDDPTRWEDDWDPSREMLAIDRCDVVVANMWKASVGTTVGVIHARMAGKPVILVDPNHLDNPILRGLVHPESPVETLEYARDRLRYITAEYKPLEVEKKDGTRVPFSRQRLTRSIRAACVAADVDDPMFPARIIGLATEGLRSESAAKVVRTRTIKEVVYRILDQIELNPMYPSEIKDKARTIKAAWARREQMKDVEQLFDEAVERARKLEEENRVLSSNLAELRRFRPPARAPERAPEKELVTVEDAVIEAQRLFENGLVILDSARDSARESPYRHPEKVFVALECLARCAEARAEARNSGGRVPGIKGWFAENRHLAPWLEYKPKESATTMGKWGDERSFPYKGETLGMEQHLAIGAGGPESTLRIHFSTDAETHQFIVGHVGRHLTTTSS